MAPDSFGQHNFPMINGARVVIRLVGGPAHDFVLSVPVERIPPFLAVGVDQIPATYYPDNRESEVRIYRYAAQVTN
jgi:hypothetical protein